MDGRVEESGWMEGEEQSTCVTCAHGVCDDFTHAKPRASNECGLEAETRVVHINRQLWSRKGGVKGKSY